MCLNPFSIQVYFYTFVPYFGAKGAEHVLIPFQFRSISTLERLNKDGEALGLNPFSIQVYFYDRLLEAPPVAALRGIFRGSRDIGSS